MKVTGRREDLPGVLGTTGGGQHKTWGREYCCCSPPPSSLYWSSPPPFQ